jgi:two-component system KDP operon response regulator KdpE
MGERILVIEDDGALARLMRLQLERAGYEVAVRTDGPSGLDKAQSFNPDLVLLDILLPAMDGWTVCKRLQEIVSVPIIFTTALGAESHMSRGLELGADDYIIKPFSNRELLARVKAALYRAQRAKDRKETYQWAGLSVNLETHSVSLNGERVFLTPLEYKLLAALVQEAGHVVTHQALLRRVWGPEYEERRQYLKLYIWYLRQKIEADPSRPQFILTERGVGYRLATSQRMEQV